MVPDKQISIYSGSTEIILIAIFTILFWWYSNKKQSYWKDRNIPYVKPLPFLGSLLDVMTTPMTVLELKRYFSLGPIYGLFEGNRPVITIADPQLIRDIFVKDFANFQNRRPLQTGNKLCDQSLLFLEGDDWKRIRAIVSPTFTTSKLKRILGIFKDCSKTLVQNFKVPAQKNEPVDAKRALEAFVMDVIASSAFSTKIDSLNDPNNEFVEYASKNMGKVFKLKMCLIMLLTYWPLLMKLFNISIATSDSLEFFSNITKQIINERRRKNQTRDDFLQLLLDTENEPMENGKEANEKKIDENENGISAKNVPDTNERKSLKNLTNDELVSQCVIFFFAAYDTTSSSLAFVLYTLAMNHDIQEKAYQEVSQHLQETNGELTYEALQKMKYLDNIISEALRLYPPALRISRRTEREYQLGDTGITLEKDMVVLVPTLAIHRDPKYYPDPEKFDPDRFSAEEVAKRDPYVYLPFGHGPRNCIGMRFAQLSAKVCLVYVISSFRIDICSKTQIPVEFDSGSYFVLHPKDVTVALEIRNNSPLVFN